MKRGLILLLAALTLCLCLGTSALAAEGTYVYDVSGAFNAGAAAQLPELNARAAELSAQYECGIYAVLIPNYSAYGASIERAAEEIYKGNDFGWGEERSGVLLLIDTVNRKYDVAAYGYGNVAFTDYGKTRLVNAFVDNLKNDDWAGGVRDFVETSGDMLARARDGRPVDIQDRKLAERVGPMGVALGVVVFPCLVALIVCTNLKRKMKSVAKATSAALYTVPNSLHVYESSDVYSHTTETRVKVESDSSRGGGGGGTSVNSGGFSHSSGSF